MSLLGTIASDVGTAYDYLTPGKGSSSLTNWGHAQNAPAPTPAPNYGNGSTPATTGSNAPDLSSQYTAAMNAALAAKIQPVPRVVSFDAAGAYKSAQVAAQNAVNPVYTQMMNNFLAGQQTALKTQQDTTAQSSAALDTAAANTLADNATSQTRAAEDNTSTVNNLETTQAANDRADGLTFDAANRALNAQLGASGTAESGLGQGTVSDAQIARKAASDTQQLGTQNNVDAANTAMNRTFEDLNTSNTRATAADTTGKQSLQVNLEDFINGQQSSLATETATENLQKSTDILTATQNNEQQLVNQWLQSLAGKGYTAQEIANAAAVYKG